MSGTAVPDGWAGEPDDPTLSPGELRALRKQQLADTLQPGQQVGGYTVTALLGVGAMGAVYRAHSDTLDRDVALKVLNPAGLLAADAVARFRREAQAAARLAGHPNVAGVHDMGETAGTAWFAMELVEGHSLQEDIEAERLDDRTIARYLVQAARGVHHAHEQGILHRDLKPANLMVGNDGIVRVTDFGLASITGAAGDGQRLTLEGAALGTPAYMPREQALGEGSDRRSDVYGLGATLFHAVTGRTPVAGSSLQVMLEQVVEGALPPARSVRRDLDPALAAICDRALALEPRDRFATAAEFADDLERWLGGRAVRAGRGGPAGRAWRGVTRRPWTAAVVLFALAGMGAGLAYLATAGGAPERTPGAGRAELARQVAGAFYDLSTRTREAMAALEAHVHGRRLAPAELQRHLDTVDRCAAEAATAFPLSRLPAAWGGLARVYAGRTEQGLQALADATAAAGPDPFPQVLLARAQLARWTEGVELPDLSFQDRVMRGRLQESQGMADARAAAAAALQQALASPLWPALPRGREVQQFAEAVTALVEHREAEASPRLAELRDDPLLGNEAALLHGLALFLQWRPQPAVATWRPLREAGWSRPAAWMAHARSAYAVDRALQHLDAEADFAAAAADFDAAVRMGPSPRLRRARAQLFGLWARHRHERGGRLHQPAARATTELAALLQQHPTDSRLLSTQALLLWLRAEAGDGDADALRAAAWTAIDAAITADPDYASALVNRAGWHRARATAAEARGDDPGPHVERALSDLERALVLTPLSRAALIGRAQTLQIAARLARARGEDGDPWYARARADLDRLLEHYPTAATALVARGTLLEELGGEAGRRGHDARPRLRAAIADFAAATRAAPRHAGAWSSLGNAERELAQADRGRGDDPGPALQRSLDAFARGLELRPNDAGLRMNRSLTLLEQGRMARDRGADPTGYLRAALRDCDAALAAAPRMAGALVNRGVVHQRMGDDLVRTGGDAAAHYARAIADFTQALEIHPKNREALNGRALVHKSHGERLARAGADPRTAYRAAEADFGRLLELDPGYVSALSNRATVRIALAQALQARGGDPRPVLAAARADCDAALARKPDYANAHLNRGTAWQLDGEWQRALADFDTAARLNPRLWQAWAAGGWACQQLGRRDAAITRYERALALNPGLAFIRKQLETLRGR